jgi:LPXTG-motif cell wall-anchored protein
MKKSTALSLAVVAATAPMIALAPAAAADGMGHHRHHRHHGELQMHAGLDPVPTNRVHGHGWTRVSLQGDKATVRIKVDGLLDNAPHAQHIHIAAKGVCPPASAATRHKGHLAISTVDGQPFYGRIGASLTTIGDTSPDSALAVKRFPNKGSYFYSRTIKVNHATAESLRDGTAVIVVHGIDYNRNGRYDYVLGKSELDPSLPLEATAPALCGALKKGPGGPVHGGVGGTQAGDDSIAMTAAGGGLALLAAGGTVYLRRRRSAQS